MNLKIFVPIILIPSLLLIIVLNTLCVFAAEVTLTWDASSGNPTGYRIYYGTTQGSHPNRVDVGTVTEYTLAGLQEGVTYYFVSRAYNGAGESGDSNEVSWISSTIDTQAPNVSITGPSSTSMLIINLTGTASDNESVTEVTWVNSRGGSGVAEGTTNWSVTGVSLMEGENVITVSARDHAGNVGNATLNVVLTAPGEPPQSQCSQNIALGKAVEDGGVIYDSMPGTKAIDGIKNTSGNYWAGIGSPNWILIDLQNTYTIDKIIARPYGWNAARYYYDDEWEIKYSLDKTNWRDFTNVTKVRGNGTFSGSGIQIINGNPGEGNHEGYKEYEFTFNPTDVRYIRFYVSKGDIDNDSNLEEIEIYTFCEDESPSAPSPPVAPSGLKLISGK